MTFPSSPTTNQTFNDTSNGSTLSYVFDGTGWVSRTNDFSDLTINLADEGLLPGDDIYGPFQAAVDKLLGNTLFNDQAGVSVPGGVIEIPAGEYTCSQRVVDTNDSTGVISLTVKGSGINATIIRLDDDNTTGFIGFDSGVQVSGFYDLRDLSIFLPEPSVQPPVQDQIVHTSPIIQMRGPDSGIRQNRTCSIENINIRPKNPGTINGTIRAYWTHDLINVSNKVRPYFNNVIAGSDFGPGVADDFTDASVNYQADACFRVDGCYSPTIVNSYGFGARVGFSSRHITTPTITSGPEGLFIGNCKFVTCDIPIFIERRLQNGNPSSEPEFWIRDVHYNYRSIGLRLVGLRFVKIYNLLPFNQDDEEELAVTGLIGPRDIYATGCSNVRILNCTHHFHGHQLREGYDIEDCDDVVIEDAAFTGRFRLGFRIRALSSGVIIRNPFFGPDVFQRYDDNTNNLLTEERSYETAVEKFNGTGTQNSFTTSRNLATTDNIAIEVDGVPQTRTLGFASTSIEDYTINYNTDTITFTNNPPAGVENVVVKIRFYTDGKEISSTRQNASFGPSQWLTKLDNLIGNNDDLGRYGVKILSVDSEPIQAGYIGWETQIVNPDTDPQTDDQSIRFVVRHLRGGNVATPLTVAGAVGTGNVNVDATPAGNFVSQNGFFVGTRHVIDQYRSQPPVIENIGGVSDVSLSTNSIEIAGGINRIDAGALGEELHTINPPIGQSLEFGDRIYILGLSDGNTTSFTIKHNVGNIRIAGGASFEPTLSTGFDIVSALYLPNFWLVEDVAKQDVTSVGGTTTITPDITNNEITIAAPINIVDATTTNVDINNINPPLNTVARRGDQVIFVGTNDSAATSFTFKHNVGNIRVSGGVGGELLIIAATQSAVATYMPGTGIPDYWLVENRIS